MREEHAFGSHVTPILTPALHEWGRDLGQAPQPSWPQPLSAELGWCSSTALLHKEPLALSSLFLPATSPRDLWA